jgi:hypothetical protein
MTRRDCDAAGAWLDAIVLPVAVPLGLIHFVGWPCRVAGPPRASATRSNLE